MPAVSVFSAWKHNLVIQYNKIECNVQWLQLYYVFLQIEYMIGNISTNEMYTLHGNIIMESVNLSAIFAGASCIMCSRRSKIFLAILAMFSRLCTFFVHFFSRSFSIFSMEHNHGI